MKQNDFYEVNGCTWFIPVDLIGENKCTKDLEVVTRESGRITFVPSIYKFLKPPEPEKVVVHKFVAEWIKKYKEKGRRLSHALEKVFDDAELGLYIKQQEGDYTETIARAWLAYPNIEVAKEKLYTVEIAEAILTKIIRGRNVQYKMLPSRDVSDVFDAVCATKLTEQEIKQKDERLWQFAKEID